MMAQKLHYTLVGCDGECLNFRDVYAVDLNGDGGMDVLSASQNDDGIGWHKSSFDGVVPVSNVSSSNDNGTYQMMMSFQSRLLE